MGLDYNKVFHYNKANKKYEEYSSLKKQFTTLKPAEAYFIYSLHTNTWKIPNTSAVNTTTFVYDGDGGRVRKTVSLRGASPQAGDEAISTTYIGSLFEISQNNSTKYIYAGANRICSVEGTVAAGFSLRYYHTDHIGSSNVITDANGNQTGFTEFTPYGTTYKQTGTTDPKYKFTGKELDNSTGLYYYGARYYDPEIGRFAQADTIVQAPYDPQSLNRYSYCRNNPINYTDPTGHKWSWKKFWHAAVGALVGVALVAVLGPIGMGMSLAMAGMWGGMVGGALTGGLDGGWRGALIGGVMGGTMGALGGWAVAGNHSGALAGMFVAGAGYSGATDSWDSFSGGIIGTIAGSLIGGGIVNANKEEFSNSMAGYGFKSDSSCQLEKTFGATQRALETNYSEDIGVVETYYRNLEGQDAGSKAFGRVHSFMRDTWSGEFHELQTTTIGGASYSTFLNGDISLMSKGTQNYWSTFPLSDRFDYVSINKYYGALSNFQTDRTYSRYNINIFTHYDDCQGFRNYSIDRSKILYGRN